MYYCYHERSNKRIERVYNQPPAPLPGGGGGGGGGSGAVVVLRVAFFGGSEVEVRREKKKRNEKFGGFDPQRTGYLGR